MIQSEDGKSWNKMSTCAQGREGEDPSRRNEIQHGSWCGSWQRKRTLVGKAVANEVCDLINVIMIISFF